MKQIITTIVIISLNILGCYAQTIIPGTYIGTDNENIMIVSEDSVCFRLQTSWGLVVYSLGIGSHKTTNGMMKVSNNNHLLVNQLTSLSETERPDSSFSVRIIDSDGLPIEYGWIEVLMEENGSKANTKKSKKCLLKHKRDEKIVPFTDSDGRIDTSFLSPYLNKRIIIHLQTVGYNFKSSITIKKGFDYLIRIEMPSNIGCGVCSDGLVNLNITPIEKDTLLFILEEKWVPNNIEHKSMLVRISDESEMDYGQLLKHNAQIYKEIIHKKQKGL